MPLVAGERFGSYEIVAFLGAGGMGEVYRARDTRLNRDVAIKILHPSVAQDPEGLARFSREAQVLASLNHPHIAQIHGVDAVDNQQFLVLELVDGESLATRVAEGALPVDDALAIATQIAAALAAAHEHGVVHRDLKPANIALTRDHRVKVLDFGLAKPVARTAMSSTDVTRLASTSPALMTRAGMILGTAAYMSPEQAKGMPIDRRTDVWAFGAVLYEMLTGQRAFKGESAAEVIGAILHVAPDWTALPAATPPAVHRLLRRCLERDPARRLRDLGDAQLDLVDHDQIPVAPSPTIRRVRRFTPFALIALTGVTIGGLVMWTLQRGEAAPPAEPTRFTVAFPVDIAPERTGHGGRSIAISPDGRRIVVVGRSPGVGSQLWQRSLDREELTPIPGTEGGYAPFFSPDGRWIGFFAQQQLKKLALSGGAPVSLCPVERAVAHGTWGRDGTILFAGPSLARISEDGGEPEIIIKSENESFRWPEFLPDGHTVVFTVVRPKQIEYDVGLMSLATRERRTLVRGASAATFVAPGHLVYAQQVSSDSGDFFGGIFAVPFDPARLQTVGAAFPVLDGVFVRDGGAAVLGISRGGGTLAYISRPDVETRIVLVDREGRARPLSEARARFEAGRISPDGRRLLVTRRAPNRALLIFDLLTGSPTVLPTGPGEDQTAIWSHDGLRIAFGSDERGEVFWKLADPTAPVERLATIEHVHVGSWSPDGRLIAIDRLRSPTTGWDIELLDVQSRSIRPFLSTRFREEQGVFSPDGRWFAYTSNESGRDEVYVTPFPGPGEARKISVDGGTQPRWAMQGTALFFRNGPHMLMADVSLSPEFSAKRPRTLFEGPYEAHYDVSPDGRQFAMVQRLESDDQRLPGLRVVVNWVGELRRRAAEQADGTRTR